MSTKPVLAIIKAVWLLMLVGAVITEWLVASFPKENLLIGVGLLAWIAVELAFP